MATVKQIVGSRTLLTNSALDSLASATYVSAGTLTHNTNQPLDVMIEVTAVPPGTITSNKQLLVFAKASLDGTNWSTGPASGTGALDEPDLYPVGSLPLNTNSVAQTKTFSLAAAFGGKLPHSSEIIVKNETGAALAASGHSVYYSEISATVA